MLKILDATAAALTFPVLDNGYVYLAATRLAAFQANGDWALVIEVFGFSPRSGFPDTAIYTFASRLVNRRPPESYVDRTAYDRYIKNNPNNELDVAFPIDEGAWLDEDDPENVVADASTVSVRGVTIPIPSRDAYAVHGIDLENPSSPQTFELCRYLAETRRPLVLATDAERRRYVPSDLRLILELNEWHHPDISGNQRPSDTRTFQQLAKVLEEGDPRLYAPDEPVNTHWKNWPEGGRL